MPAESGEATRCSYRKSRRKSTAVDRRVAGRSPGAIPDHMETRQTERRRISKRRRSGCERPEPEPVAEPSALDRCTQDWKELPSAAFRAKWMSNPQLKAVVDQMFATGRA